MPNEWVYRPLSELADFYSGGTPNKATPEFWGGPIPWVTVKDMKAMRLSSVVDSLTQSGANTVRIAPAGSVLVLVRGMGLFKDLPVVLCDRPVAFNQDIKALVPVNGILSEFLAYSLVAAKADILRHVESAGHGTGRLDTDLLRSTPLPVPPVREQQKIVEILRTWDEAINLVEALRNRKELRVRGMAQRLLAPSRTIGSNIPKSNWALTALGDIFKERQDRNAGLGAEDVVTVGKYAIRKQSEHFSRSVASKDQSNYWTISPRDFVYDPMSAYYGAIGRYDGTKDGIVSPAYRVIQLSAAVDSDFMVHLLRSHHIRYLFETRSSQGNKEGKRRLFQRDEFTSIEFNLPPLELQREIARKLAVFIDDVKATSRLLITLDHQKRGLIEKLLNGEASVRSEKLKGAGI
jgi:type I restriction enzyme S subunit